MKAPPANEFDYRLLLMKCLEHFDAVEEVDSLSYARLDPALFTQKEWKILRALAKEVRDSWIVRQQENEDGLS